MKKTFLRMCCLVVCMCAPIGCVDVSSTDRPDAALKHIKFSDLKPTTELLQTESQLSFSIWTYELDSDLLDQISRVFRILSKLPIRYDNKTAFNANGFAVSVGAIDKGSEVVQTLTEIGAKRTGQGRLLISSHDYEVLSWTPIESQTFRFPISHRSVGSVELEAGKLGWIISASKDPKIQNLVRVEMQPAYWLEGMSDLRLMEGKAPFVFRTFNVGRCEVEMEGRQFIVLAPAGAILKQQTLNQQLFGIPGQDKVRIFLMILERVEN